MATRVPEETPVGVATAATAMHGTAHSTHSMLPALLRLLGQGACVHAHTPALLIRGQHARTGACLRACEGPVPPMAQASWPQTRRVLWRCVSIRVLSLGVFLLSQ